MQFSLTQDANGTVVKLDGEIVDDTGADLERLKSALVGPRVIINAAGVSKVNSVGVVVWRQFLESIHDRFKIEFVECSVTFLGYVTMLPTFAGKGRVKSFYMPLSCRPCKSEGEVLVDAAELARTRSLPPCVCTICGDPMSPDLDVDDVVACIKI